MWSLKPFIVVLLVVAFFAGISRCQNDEDSQCFAWVVRRLAGNDVRIPGTSVLMRHSRPGKMGPIGPPGRPGGVGPKGDPGTCECDSDEIENLKETVKRLEGKMRAVETALGPEACLLGMKSGLIPDSAITVSSAHPASYCPRTNSRLDHYGSWCSGSRTVGTEWIEVDLGKIRTVTGVISQGANYQSVSEWVTAFRVEYGIIAGSRTAITENSRTKIFSPVNVDENTKVVTRFPRPVKAKYIRIVPTSYHNHISMRFDVIDC